MKKQILKNSFKAMLLALSMLALMAILASSVIAQTGEGTQQLTLDFDTSMIESVTVNYTDADGRKQTADVRVPTEITFRQATDVILTIKPGRGYKPVSAFDSVSGVEQLQIADGGFACSWKNHADDISVSITCETRTFTVIAKDYDEKGPISYDPVGMTKTELTGGSIKHTYMGAALTELPTVSMEHYDFKEWQIITVVAGEDGQEATRKTSAVFKDHAWYIPADIANDAIDNDVIYVYPVFTPQNQTVLRQDIIQGTSVSLTHGDHSFIWQYPITDEENDGDEITALEYMGAWELQNGYTSYPGYTMLLDPSLYPAQEIGPDETTRNILTRYFIANRYKLDYQNVDADYAKKEYYVYGDYTEIANPAPRLGYTFTGWTILLTKNGETVEIKVDVAIDPEDYQKNQFIFAQTGANFNCTKNEDETYTCIRIDPNDLFAADADAEGNGTITMIANWEHNSYTIGYDWSIDESDTELAAKMAELNGELIKLDGFKYEDPENPVVTIGKPVRPGYTFAGWSLRYTNAAGELVTVQKDDLTDRYDAEGKLLLSTGAYASDIVLVANWTPEKYTVTLDPGTDGAFPGETSELTDVVYDREFTIPDGVGSVIPTRRGYKFLGFFTRPEGQGTQYITADGTAVAGILWKEDDGISDGRISLYAHWEPDSFDTVIRIDGIDGDALDNVTITITPSGGESFKVQNGTPFTVVYGTSFTVTITTQDGYKVVIVGEDGSLSYATEYSIVDKTCDWIEANTITVKVLPVRELKADDIIIDYPNETIGGLAPGRYYVLADGVQTVFQVVANQAVPQSIDSAWFGKTIQLTYCGDGVNTSDSDPVSVTLAARPAKPSIYSTLNPTGEIKPLERFNYTITITMVEGIDASLYEFAVVEYGSGNSPVWQSAPTFENVKPGTMYDIYVRVKATATAPHGEEFVVSDRTTHDQYIKDKTTIINGLRGDAHGDVANALLDDLLAKLEQLNTTKPVPDDFYAQVEALMAGIDEALALANKKDDTIKALTAVLAECKSVGDYGDFETRLDARYSEAVAAITTDAKTEEDVTKCFNDAVAAMKQIPVMKIWDADVLITLESPLGLDQTAVLNLIRDENFEELARAVHDAIRKEVKVGPFMTQADAEKLLRTLDVVAYYNFTMSNADKVQANDTFTICLTLPEDLIGKTGLQVAYYDEENGSIELLKTWLSEDGKSLIFEAKEVRHFVILADPTINLTGVLLVLGGVLLLQIIALAFILYLRSKNKNGIAHASLALPAMLLTVHFTPVNGEILAMLLTAAIIVMQIVLMILLLKSDMIYLSSRRREEEDSESVVPEEPIDEAATAPDAEVTETETAEPTADEAMFTTETVTLAVALEETGAAETEAESDDPFAIYEDDVLMGEDFIEPAATTRYSLPDEEPIAFEADDGVYDEETVFDDGTMEEMPVEDDEDLIDETFADEDVADEEIYDEELLEEAPYLDESYPDAETDTDYFSIDENTAEDEDYTEEDGSYDELPYIGELGDEVTEEELEDVNALYGDEGTFYEDEEDATEEDVDPLYRYDE